MQLRSAAEMGSGATGRAAGGAAAARGCHRSGRQGLGRCLAQALMYMQNEAIRTPIDVVLYVDRADLYRVDSLDHEVGPPCLGVHRLPPPPPPPPRPAPGPPPQGTNFTNCRMPFNAERQPVTHAPIASPAARPGSCRRWLGGNGRPSHE